MQRLVNIVYGIMKNKTEYRPYELSKARRGFKAMDEKDEKSIFHSLTREHARKTNYVCAEKDIFSLFV
ncbi:MAG: hypothetical protein ACYC5K_08135 [Saccharofermentanales bacterium]